MVEILISAHAPTADELAEWSEAIREYGKGFYGFVDHTDVLRLINEVRRLRAICTRAEEILEGHG